ncbi:SMI1/KNR4 family protein [Xenorhabdus sp. M]|uniref:SMI1/KNR4 family protein n=1 Tax=Xenorhabdus szentirmaii TaxID=290112 RepID=A0AAW3YSQ6_9GAMM|nr:SMI1/KNR4 family protein [Xenorhabdus sp. M]MBD2800046.1 SMI1/KNR4 family protein [Xenorhabdus sp. M]
MTTKIIDFKTPVNEGLISDFEQKIGSSLPNEYRLFLEKYNGGYPEPSSFQFFDSDNIEDGSSVDRFLSLGCEKYHDLNQYFINYKDRIPPNFLPIAHDPGGNLILISLNHDKPAIFFWDHEFEADEDEGELPNMSNVHFISHSFPDFLKRLCKTEI